ncbi:MAG: hypothetical protein IPK64_00185 [bacterium]|nr:hypothetical protein [bacterium]
MPKRIRILLALLGCLVIGANALAATHAHCDPLCCDEPCESGPLAPVPDCTCCAVRGSTDTDPLLPTLTPTAPQPALLPLPPALPTISTDAGPAALTAVPVPPPTPARTTILRL